MSLSQIRRRKEVLLLNYLSVLLTLKFFLFYELTFILQKMSFSKTKSLHTYFQQSPL